MARPVKWSRDLHAIREKAARSRAETWSRVDLEHLFGVGRATAQMLMKAIGDLQVVGGAHFVERTSLLRFLDAMIAAPSVDEALRARMLEAEPALKSKPLRVSLPNDLRSARLPDLPANIILAPGRLEITVSSAVAMLETLLALAMVMQNDLERFQEIVEPLGEVLGNGRELRDVLGVIEVSSRLT
ncbi:MAG: hypothetical protein ACRYFU_03035 [Janthinobacterium lividum]